jgi:hypothetical protein
LFATIFGLGQWHGNTPKKKTVLPTSAKKNKTGPSLVQAKPLIR